MDTVYENNFYNSVSGFDDCHQCKYSILMTSSRAFRFCSPLMLKGVIEANFKSISPSDWFYPLVLFQSSYELAISRALGRCPEQFYPWVLDNISFGNESSLGRVLAQAGWGDLLETAQNLNKNLNAFLTLSGHGHGGSLEDKYAYRTAARRTDPLNFMFNTSHSSLYNGLSVDDNFLAPLKLEDDDELEGEDEAEGDEADDDNNDSIMSVDPEYDNMYDHLEEFQENNFFASVLSYGLGFNRMNIIGSFKVSSQPAVNPFYGPKWSIFYPLIQAALIRDDAKMMEKVFIKARELYNDSEYLSFKLRVMEYFFIAAVHYDAVSIYKVWLPCALVALEGDILQVVDRIADILRNENSQNWIAHLRTDTIIISSSSRSSSATRRESPSKRYKACDDMYANFGFFGIQLKE